MRPTHQTRSPRVRVAALTAALAAALTAALLAPAARAQGTPAVLREGIVGYDPAHAVLAYLELSPTAVPGFSHVTLVEAPANGTPRRVRLTTDEDVNQVRLARDRAGTQGAVEARVARDAAAAAARYAPGTELPVSESAPGTGCRRAPFAPREFTLGDGVTARTAPSPDGTGSTVALAREGRAGPAADVPGMSLTENGATVPVIYDRVADARELPGTDAVALMLRSDACTPEGTPVPPTAVLVAAAPAPEAPLALLPHAELIDTDVIPAVAPHARRRTVDDVTGYYDGRTRVVFDTAWTLPDARVLVQYTRLDPDLSPVVADLGVAPTRFAVLAAGRRGRWEVLSDVAPPLSENVFEGTGQEAYAADLDGDGQPEWVVRARYRPSGEIATVLRWDGHVVQFVWRGQTQLDDRAAPAGAQAHVRACALGTTAGPVLVLRCREDTYTAGAAPDALPTATARVLQTLRWSGALVQLREERR